MRGDRLPTSIRKVPLPETFSQVISKKSPRTVGSAAAQGGFAVAPWNWPGLSGSLVQQILPPAAEGGFQLLDNPSRGIPPTRFDVLNIPEMDPGEVPQPGLRKSFRLSKSPKVLPDSFCNRVHWRWIGCHKMFYFPHYTSDFWKCN
jgi:hypothetical protein